MTTTLNPIAESLDVGMIDMEVCETCILVSNGYSDDELGYTPHTDAATYWNVSVAMDEDTGEMIGRFTACDICETWGQCFEAMAEPFGTAGAL